jgi:hypothetical protein
MATDDFGDGKHRTPVVGKAVVGGGGQDGIAGGNAVEVILGPAGEFAGEEGFGFDVGTGEPSGEFAGFGFG